MYIYMVVKWNPTWKYQHVSILNTANINFDKNGIRGSGSASEDAKGKLKTRKTATSQEGTHKHIRSSQLMVNLVVWGPVVWIPIGSPKPKGIVFLRGYPDSNLKPPGPKPPINHWLIYNW